MVKAGTASRAITEDTKVLASLRAVNERRSLKLKAFVVHFKRLDLGSLTGGCPNQIVLVGRSPAPHGFLLPRLHHLIFNSSHEGRYPYRPLYVL